MSFFSLIKSEFRAIFTNITIVLTVVGGTILYSFLYPQPYINQLPYKQKVVLIDLDNSTISRKLSSLLNATPQIDLYRQVKNINIAKNMIQNGEAMGYFLIPENFSKDLSLQKSPTLAYGANASYFLVYGTIVEAMYDVISHVSKDIIVSRKLISENEISSKRAIEFDSKPAFNLNNGYVNYVVPAVFILIFHQIMLIGAGLQGATQTEEKVGYWLKVSPLKLIFARVFVYMIIYLPIGIYYMGFCFVYYNIPHIANINTLTLFILSLAMSTTFLGIFLGEIIPRRELVTFFVLLSSLPLVFSSGFVWPTQSISPWLNFIVQWFPAVPGIISFLKLNQMGVDFLQTFNQWIQICALGFFYFLLSWLIMRYKRAKSLKYIS